MKSFATENIRNLAVIGHGDAGKTQLVSSLLHVAGSGQHRWGKVDEGTTVTDYEEDSIARKVSLNNNFAHVDYKDTNLLRKFISDRGKIRARRVTGNCVQHQRDVATAVKNSREVALLPYTSTAR